MLTALLGAAFLFVPHENVSAAEPIDTISVSSVESTESADSDWLTGYYYELLDDEDGPFVKLKKCYLSVMSLSRGLRFQVGRLIVLLLQRSAFQIAPDLPQSVFLKMAV